MTIFGLSVIMWLTILSLLLSLLCGATCLFLYLDSLRRPLKSDLPDLLEKLSESVLKQYKTQFHALETEWDDMYQKFGRLAGRMDRQKALAPSQPVQEDTSQTPQTRADLLRRYRNK